MDNTYIDKLTFILIKDKKVLMTKARGKDVWLSPGGKRDEGESDEQALIREVKEELAVDIIPETIKYFGSFEAQAHGKAEGTFVKMNCYTADYTGELHASAEIEELDWFTSNDMDRTSITGRLILEDLKNKGLID
jgi:8-oxo-dGTP pyrophosphatase MutT (NUDIX family)